MATVELAVGSDGVAHVTINRPEVLNAVDHESHDAFHRIWHTIEQSEDVRVVVLTGAGDRSFCAGSDMKSPGSEGVEYWASSNPDGYCGLTVRESLDVPVIARVNGYALGGGLELMLGADIVVAADHAQFGLVEPLVGRLPLSGGIPAMVRALPRRFAMDLLLTARRIGAEEALRMGLVNKVVPMGELDTAVKEYVDQILRCAPLSVRAVKSVVNRTSNMTARQAASQLLPPVVAALRSADATEGVAAFRERREPQWQGR
jgi:crotonobetainyl-CoA hydratase